MGSSFDDDLSAVLNGTRNIVRGGAGADFLDVEDGDALDRLDGGADADSCFADIGEPHASCP